MAKSSRALPFPGLLKGKQQVNLDAIRTLAPFQVAYYEFKVSDFRSAKPIITLPRNTIVVNPIKVAVTTEFDEWVTLSVGIGTDPTYFGGPAIIGIVDEYELGVTGSAGYMNPIREDTYALLFMLPATSTSSTPVTGEGFLIMQFLLLNDVSSYREIKGYEPRRQ